VQTDPLPAGNYVATANAAVSSSAETALCWFDPVSTGGNTDDGWTMSFGTTTTETTATLSLWDRFPSIAANDSIGLYCDNTGGSEFGSTTYTNLTITVMPVSSIDVKS